MSPGEPLENSRSEERLGRLTRSDVLEEARRLLRVEAEAVSGLADALGDAFVSVMRTLLDCDGLVVVTGMGKSGLVAQKISATLASTGTPSIFLHAGDAAHGDLGRLGGRDVVLALSNSGESEEILRLIRPVRGLGAPVIAMTGDHSSSLAQQADMILCIGDVTEAGSLGLVPTVSTTAMIALGDALSVCLFECRGFGPEEYARFHPGGSLGRKLMRVYEVMRQGDANPVVRADATIREALRVMTCTSGRPGAATVVDAAGRVVGFLTDGDLRRLLERDRLDIHASVESAMHREPKSVGPDQLVAEAATLMRQHKIDQVPVIDKSRQCVGFLDVQDLLSTRAW